MLPLIDRRRFLALTSASPWLLRSTLLLAERPINSIRVGEPVAVPHSSGDTWVATLAGDGNLYSASNDTHGFDNAANSNLAFNQIQGRDAVSLSGRTVNPMYEYGKASELGADHCSWKSSGCLWLDGALYLLVARHTYGENSADPYKRQNAANASFIRSTDYGKTWTRSAAENYAHPMFPGSRFATPYFIDYGRQRPSVDMADRYIYALSNNGFWDNGDDVVLGRVLRSKMAALNGADWEYYAGGDGSSNGSWSPEMTEVKPLLEGARSFGMTGAVYLPARRRYLMVAWHYPAGSGKINKEACTETIWTFYESPHPWGPWQQRGSHRFSPQGYYCPEICPEFQSEQRVYVFTAGNWNNADLYRLTVVPLELS